MGQVVVITGASAGIGRATAWEFARKGAFLGLLARDKKRLEEVKKEVERFGGKAVIIPTDVSHFNQVKQAADQVEKEFGPIDIWINNAMVTVFSPITKITPEEYRQVTDVTYHGTVYGTMVALSRMRPRNKGVIVQVGSALAYRAIPLQAPYCGAKHAIRAFTDSLRVELMHEKKNIHVVMVQLPAHNTPQFSWAQTHMQKHPQPVPPIYQPELAAKAIVFAATHKRREVWVGKPAVATIFMSKLFPLLVDRYLSLFGFDSQIAEIPFDPKRPNNLFQTVLGDFSAHGVFDKQARKTDVQFAFEQVPLVHYITDLIFAVITSIGMIPKFLKKLW